MASIKSNNKKRDRQIWTVNQDVLLCREILVTRPYQHQKGSKESAIGWAKITEELKTVEGFMVTIKALRDHFSLLVSKRKAQKASEERASGINVEGKDIDILLDVFL